MQLKLYIDYGLARFSGLRMEGGGIVDVTIVNHNVRHSYPSEPTDAALPP
jgi:hypothetical protein